MTNKICAPGKGNKKTCYSLESLKKIATSYNENHTDKIEITDDIEVLYDVLKEKLQKFCSNDEKCWKGLPFVKQLEDEEIEHLTFKPPKPQGQWAWLSTIDIDKVMAQLVNIDPTFKFLGAVPMDFDDLHVLGIRNLNFRELEDSQIKHVGIVFNTDEHYKSGEHWIAAYANFDKKQVYFFDSVGTMPEKRVTKFLARIVKHLIKTKKCKLHEIDVMHNYLQHQKGNSECGVYCINFLRRLVRGETFEQIIQNRLSDEKVNQCRDVYFSK